MLALVFLATSQQNGKWIWLRSGRCSGGLSLLEQDLRLDGTLFSATAPRLYVGLKLANDLNGFGGLLKKPTFKDELFQED
ncbi:hypothetical protein [Variovorax sp. OV084]|uniref:hypothetical protein n=1 Tax=Variovorax sp. OV084 TaxID=1882777 RepID=UPI001C434C13|nr:hypothetical protein [Variovorax sp. OV084]